MADTKIDTTRHEATEDPSGLALRCSCGQWSMLFRNSLGLHAPYEHAQHATRSFAIAAAESRGRTAGYAEAVAKIRQIASTNGPLFAPLQIAAFLGAVAPSATTEEPAT